MQSKAKTVKQYLKSLPADKKLAIETVRKVVLNNLPKGFEERMQGMIVYEVPLKIFPAGYLGDKNVPLPFAGLASQKNYMALYLLSVYANKDLDKWFRNEYKKSGKKLNMGKSCVRFKKISELDLPTIGKVLTKISVKQFIDQYKKIRKR